MLFPPKYILWLRYHKWVLGETCQSSKTCLRSHSGPSSLSSTASVWSCQTPSTTTTVLEITRGCQGFTLVVHNVRQPVLCCGDGMSVEHTGPMFSCQMQPCKLLFCSWSSLWELSFGLHKENDLPAGRRTHRLLPPSNAHTHT